LHAGLFVGVVATALAELTDDQNFDESDFKELVPVPMLTEISSTHCIETIH